MNYITKPLVAFGILATLAACAAPPQPQVIYAEPTFDKYGNAECSSPTGPNGSTAAQSTLPPCVPEDDGCYDGNTPGTASVPCIPGSGQESRGDRGNPTTPGAGPNNPGRPVV